MKSVKDWFRNRPYVWVAIGYFAFYLPAFWLLERLVPVPRYLIRCPLDDLIPFCEYFFLPYVSWFFLLAWSLLYFADKSREDFLRLCYLMFTGMTFCLGCYLLFPNGLDLRPAQLGDNLFCSLTGLLYAVDTPTNVCPSIHVSSAVAVWVTARRSALFRNRPGVRWGLFALVAAICLSTVFLKQHSVVDVVCGVALSLLLDAAGRLRSRARERVQAA